MYRRSENWIPQEKHNNRLNAMSMKYLKRLCNKTRGDRIKNEWVLREGGLNTKLTNRKICWLYTENVYVWSYTENEWGLNYKSNIWRKTKWVERKGKTETTSWVELMEYWNEEISLKNKRKYMIRYTEKLKTMIQG